MQKHKDVITQIAFFGVVGVTTLGIDLSVTTLCYNILGFPAYASSAIGFLSGFFFNFPMNRKKVFRHSHLDRFSFRTQIALFTALCVFNLGFTSLAVDLIVNANLLTIGYAKLLLTGVIAVWNFLLFKLFIFSKIDTEEKEKSK